MESDPRDFVIKCVSGKFAGFEYCLLDGEEVMIGRSPDAQIALVEDMVSRRHATIRRSGEDVWLRDLKSNNGTYLAGRRISEVRLKENDRFIIGSSILALVREERSDHTRPLRDAALPTVSPRAGDSELDLTASRRLRETIAFESMEGHVSLADGGSNVSEPDDTSD